MTSVAGVAGVGDGSATASPGRANARRDRGTTVGTPLVVDARALHASGIGRYLRALLSRWIEQDAFDGVTLLGEPEALTAFVRPLAGGERVRVVRHEGGFYSAAAQLSWLARGAAAVRRPARAAVFFPHWDAPLLARPRHAVVTVHDLIQFAVPDAFGRVRARVGARVLARVVGGASRIVTVSQASARDLAAMLPSLAPRLHVVANGVDAPPDALEPPRGAPYLLCVGNQKPHKNLAMAVETLARLRGEWPALRLVVAGRRFAGAESLRARATSLGLPPDAVEELGEVGDDALWPLYAGAAVLLFPSRYEGFGLPALEAMCVGTPVVASTAAALVETVGDAALLAPPDDGAAWAHAVGRVLRSPVERARLAARGRVRAAEFSWDRAARATADVLLDAAAGG